MQGGVGCSGGGGERRACDVKTKAGMQAVMQNLSRMFILIMPGLKE